MKIRDSSLSLVFFIYQIYKMKKIMKEKNQVVLGEGLSEELICQFKTETDVSIFYQKSYPNNK